MNNKSVHLPAFHNTAYYLLYAAVVVVVLATRSRVQEHSLIDQHLNNTIGSLSKCQGLVFGM